MQNHKVIICICIQIILELQVPKINSMKQKNIIINLYKFKKYIYIINNLLPMDE